MRTTQNRKNSFEHIFPLPKFLEVPTVGVDISDETVKFLQIKKENGQFRVGVFGEKKLPAGAVLNGQIKDRKALVSVLSSIKKEGIDFANVSLPEEKAFLFKVNVPNTNPRDIRTNLSYQLETKVPVALASAVFDYDLLVSVKKGAQTEAVVTVLPIDFVTSYLEAFKEAGIQPTSFEIEGQAIARAVVPKNCATSILLIDFGQNRTGLSIVTCGAVVYTSTIEIGGEIISEKIKEVMKVSDEEVVRVKNEIGFADNAPQELKEALAGSVSSLKDEILKHYNYWKTRVDDGKESPIEEVIICGGNSNIKGLREYLSDAMNIRVEKGNVWQKLFSLEDYVPPIKKELSFGYATAIGLAMADM